MARRQREDGTGTGAAGHEHAHHVVVGVVAVIAGRLQRGDHALAAVLHAQLEHLHLRATHGVEGAVRGHHPLVHDDDVVAGELDVRQQVRRDDHVDALVVGEVADEGEHLVSPLRVHAVGGLVEEQQVGIVHQCLGQLDALLHARGVGLEVAVARLTKAHVVEHLVRALHGIGAGEAGKLAAVRHKLHGRHAGDVRVALGHVAEAGPNFEGGGGDVEAQHPHAALRRHDEAEQRLEQRALPCAVGAEEADGAGGKHR